MSTPQTAVTTTEPSTPTLMSMMLDEVRADKSFKPATLRDVILSRLRPAHYYEFNSYMSSAARFLSRNYTDLVCTVIFPSITPHTKAGKFPKWAGVNPTAMDNVVPVPNWANAKAIANIATQFNSLSLANENTAKHLATVSKMGKKNYIATTSLLQMSDDKALELSVELMAETQARKAAERAITDMEERMFERLSARLLPGPGDAPTAQ